jgi:hypothetical protein
VENEPPTPPAPLAMSSGNHPEREVPSPQERFEDVNPLFAQFATPANIDLIAVQEYINANKHLFPSDQEIFVASLNRFAPDYIKNLDLPSRYPRLRYAYDQVFFVKLSSVTHQAIAHALSDAIRKGLQDANSDRRSNFNDYSGVPFDTTNILQCHNRGPVEPDVCFAFHLRNEKGLPVPTFVAEVTVTNGSFASLLADVRAWLQIGSKYVIAAFEFDDRPLFHERILVCCLPQYPPVNEVLPANRDVLCNAAKKKSYLINNEGNIVDAEKAWMWSKERIEQECGFEVLHDLFVYEARSMDPNPRFPPGSIFKRIDCLPDYSEYDFPDYEVNLDISDHYEIYFQGRSSSARVIKIDLLRDMEICILAHRLRTAET